MAHCSGASGSVTTSCACDNAVLPTVSNVIYVHKRLLSPFGNGIMTSCNFSTLAQCILDGMDQMGCRLGECHSSEAAEWHDHGTINQCSSCNKSFTHLFSRREWLAESNSWRWSPVMDVVLTAEAFSSAKPSGRWSGQGVDRKLRLHGLPCLPQASNSGALQSEATKVSLHHCWSSLPISARQHGTLFHNVLLITE